MRAYTRTRAFTRRTYTTDKSIHEDEGILVRRKWLTSSGTVGVPTPPPNNNLSTKRLESQLSKETPGATTLPGSAQAPNILLAAELTRPCWACNALSVYVTLVTRGCRLLNHALVLDSWPHLDRTAAYWWSQSPPENDWLAPPRS